MQSEKESVLIFRTFEKMFENTLGISLEIPNTLIASGLYDPDQGSYADAGLLLSDQNPFPGIDLSVYGKARTILKKRLTFENESVLDQIQKVLSVFKEHFTCETINSFYRTVKEQIPLNGFRDVLVNTVAHREWQTDVPVRIEFFENSVPIISPGRLPDGMNKEDCLSCHNLAILRNPSLVFVFRQFSLINPFGAVTANIQAAYSSYSRKLVLEIQPDQISVPLPALEMVFCRIRKKKKSSDLSEVMDRSVRPIFYKRFPFQGLR